MTTTQELKSQIQAALPNITAGRVSKEALSELRREIQVERERLLASQPSEARDRDLADLEWLERPLGQSLEASMTECPYCGGAGDVVVDAALHISVDCPYCEGEGRLAAGLIDCPQCEGTGTMDVPRLDEPYGWVTKTCERCEGRKQIDPLAEASKATMAQARRDAPLTPGGQAALGEFYREWRAFVSQGRKVEALWTGAVSASIDERIFERVVHASFDQLLETLEALAPERPVIQKAGNIFATIGRAGDALKSLGRGQEASEMAMRVLDSRSLEEALAVVEDYVAFEP